MGDVRDATTHSGEQRQHGSCPEVAGPLKYPRAPVGGRAVGPPFPQHTLDVLYALPPVPPARGGHPPLLPLLGPVRGAPRRGNLSTGGGEGVCV